MWCFVAAEHTRDLLRTTLQARASFDTLRYMPERDTLPVGVAATAKACGARFTVAGTATFDLPYLFGLALLARNDTLAHAVVLHRMTLAATDTARWAILFWAIAGYLKAEPARVAAAEMLVAQLDQQSPGALVARIHAHQQLLQFGQMTYDRRRVGQEADAILALAPQLTLTDLTKNIVLGDARLINAVDDLRSIWTSIFGLAYVYAPDSLSVLAQRVREFYRQPVLQRYLEGVQHHTISASPGSGGTDFPPTIVDTSLSALIDRFLPGSVSNSNGGTSEREGVRPGNPTPRLHAAYWFPATSGDTVQPAPGHVALILNTIVMGCLHSQGALLDNQEGSACDQREIARLQQILWRYSRAGLVVTLVTTVHADEESILGRAPASPDTVAKTIKRYIRDMLQLPVTIAIDTVSVALRVPQPDGREFYANPSPVAKHYFPATPSGLNAADPPFVILVDRKGTTLYVGNTLLNGDDGTAALLDALLARELTAQTSIAGQAPLPVPAGTAGSSQSHR